MIGCYLTVDGQPFADDAASLAAGGAVALADVEITWGRGNTVDQPQSASARWSVLDRAGGTGFADVLDVGAAVEIWARGDVSTGAPANVAVNGGFEQSPLGDPGARVTLGPGTAGTIVAAPTATGVRSLELVVSGAAGSVVIPPAAFSSDPAAWDQIPRTVDGSVWAWSIAVAGPVGAALTARPTLHSDPADTTPNVDVPTAAATGTALWQTLGAQFHPNAQTGGWWLGVRLDVVLLTWAAAPGTWATAPGAWVDYQRGHVDDIATRAPAAGLLRDALTFAGRVTDLTLTVDDAAGTVRLEATAVDQAADLANTYIGDEPWPAEPITARTNRILGLAGLPLTALIDAPLGALVVSRRDVDAQPVGALLADLAQSADGVAWSATHATRGPFLFVENMALRAQTGQLEMVGAVVEIVPLSTTKPAGVSNLDGCWFPIDEPSWVRDVSDVITRVEATWLDQSTSPDTTERTVRVVDTAAETAHGRRRLGVATQLTNATDATATANARLNRSRSPQWRTGDLTWDLGQFPPRDVTETQTALDLLDGTVRLGRGINVYNADLWPLDEIPAAYLDGGAYTFDGAWRLGLVTTPGAGVGVSATWVELDPSWAWAEFDPEIAWVDLYGIAA